MKRTGSKRQALVCALVGGSLLLTTAGLAQAEEAAEYTLDPVVVTANRVLTEVSKAAANVTVITREQIENGNYTSLGDVLREVTGVIVSGQGLAGSTQTVRLNGNDRVLILIDGRKINKPEGSGDGRSGISLSTIVSLGNIDRIEIVKGGASALYGSDAVGGVINIITRKGETEKTTLDVSTGSWGKRGYNLQTQGTEGGWSWYVTADKKYQDYAKINILNPDVMSGSKTGDTRQWPQSEYEGQGLTVRLDKTIDADRALTVNFEHWNSEEGQTRYYRDSYAPPSYPYYPSSTTAIHLSNNAALTYDFNQTTAVPGFIRLYSNYQHQEFYGPYASRSQGLQYQIGWQTDDKNKLVVGAEWIKGTVLESASGYNNKSVTNAAVYLQDIYNLTDKLTLTPGVRYDHHSRFGGQTTPKVNMNYSADKTTDVYISYNRVFNAPNLDDLYYYMPGMAGVYGGMLGDPDLQPEKGHVISGGVNKKLSNNTMLKANYFISKLSNSIHWYPDDPNDSTSDWRAYNIAREEQRGFEIELNRQLSAKYYAGLGYSYIHTEQSGVDPSLVPLVNTQPNSYYVRLGFNDQQWNVSVNGKGVAGRDANRFMNSGYWVWNMAVNYKLNQDTGLYFNIYNLTDKAYEVNSSGTATNLNGDSRGALPMAARNFQFGVKYSF